MKSFQVEAGRPEVRSGWKVSLDEEHRELIKTLKRINGQVLFKDADIQANDNSGAFIIRVMFEAFANHYCEKASDSPDDRAARLRVSTCCLRYATRVPLIPYPA